MLKIKQDIIDRIVAQGLTEAPLEACGYLAEKDGVVCKHFELTNIDKSPVHFSMDPAEQFAAVNECRNQGLKICAVTTVILKHRPGPLMRISSWPMTHHSVM